MWEDHVDWVMGDKVAGREISGIDGKVKKTPSWTLVLHYEEKLREKAAKLMSESHRSGGVRHDISTALKAARESRELLEDEFLDKLRFQEPAPRTKERARGSREAASSPSPPAPKDRKRGDKGAGKGKGNNRGGGKRPPAAGNNKVLHTKTKDKKNICFAFNRAEGCSRPECGMAHVCQICLGGKHGMHDCRNKLGKQLPLALKMGAEGQRTQCS